MPDFFTYQPGKHGSKLKIPKGSKLGYIEGKGYYAKPLPGKKTVAGVVRPTTSQSRTTIETPAQIEQRVTRMAKVAFDRERGAVETEAESMRKEAEGRRLGMIEAYKAAAQFNAGMGADVQKGWEQAANTISGLAGATTGGVSDALAADLATQEQRLARVGAGGTGFDARSQAAVEQYRGGFLPSEFYTREGAIDRQWQDMAAANLRTRGLQEGIAGEQGDVSKIDADVLSQIKDLTANRTKYESTLREQLLGARSDQITAAQKAKEFAAEQAQKYAHDTLYFNQKQAELEQKYAVAKMSATTAGEKLALDRWYKQNKLAIDNAKASAYVASQGALVTSRNAAAAKSKRGSSTTTAVIPDAWQDAWQQYSNRLDDVLDGKDPRFFAQDINGNYTLNAKYKTATGAKALQGDLIRLVGNPYKTKFPKRAKDIAARAYAKAFAIFKIYGGGGAGVTTGVGGLPSIG